MSQPNEPGAIAPSPAEKQVTRVLFGDYASVKFSTIIDWLQREGVKAEATTDASKFFEKVQELYFDVCVVNLLMGGIGPFELIQNVRQCSRNPEIKIIVVSRQVHKVNIQNAIRAGASDFIAEPFDAENLYHRIVYHLSPKQVVDPVGYEYHQLNNFQHWDYVNLLLESMELLSRTERTKEHETFVSILQRAANLLKSHRTSLIVVDKETNTGIVVASSDDPTFSDFPISLTKYPEVLHVLNSGQLVVVDDVARNTLTRAINDRTKTIHIGSLMVFPVRFQNEVVGVMTVRRKEATDVPSEDVLRIVQSIANTMAAHANVKAILRKIYKDYAPKAA